MAIRVLFADDQLPSKDEAENRAVKEQILENLGARLSDPGAAFEEDRQWFEGLLSHLETTQALELICTHHYYEAEKLIEQTEDYDVAVVDLSWTGDASLPKNGRHNVGLRLLERIQELNDSLSVRKPTIAFSQNFSNELELVANVLEHDALPIQKDYTDTGHRTLAAAIKLLSRLQTTEENKSEGDQRVGRTVWDFGSELVNRFGLWLFPIATMFMLVVLGLAHTSTQEGGKVEILGIELYKKGLAEKLDTEK